MRKVLNVGRNNKDIHTSAQDWIHRPKSLLRINQSVAAMQTVINRKTIIIIIVLLAGIVAGGMAGAILAFTRDLPQIRNLESFRPHAVTRVYSTDREMRRSARGPQVLHTQWC